MKEKFWVDKFRLGELGSGETGSGCGGGGASSRGCDWGKFGRFTLLFGWTREMAWRKRSGEIQPKGRVGGAVQGMFSVGKMAYIDYCILLK